MNSDAYRTPEEQEAQQVEDRRINVALSQAVRDGGLLMVAMETGMPPEVVDKWVNLTYDNLRRELDSEERMLRAIMLLLESQMQAYAIRAKRIAQDAEESV